MNILSCPHAPVHAPRRSSRILWALILCAAALPVLAASLRDTLDHTQDAGTPEAPSSWPRERVMRDVTYGADAAQRLDVYLPALPDHPRVLLMVHGGAWRFGDKAASGVWAQKAAHWCAQGWVVISTNYRMRPAADPLEQARDVARALAKVQQMAPSWGADPHGVVLMGHSAGAHLVSLLSAQPSLARAEGAQEWLATVSLDSGAMDVTAIMTHGHLPLYDRAFGHDPSLWRAASPTTQLSGPIVPTLLVCSTKRHISCPEARQFAARAQQLGSKAQVLEQDLSHSQINHKLGEPGDYTDAVDNFLRSL